MSTQGMVTIMDGNTVLMKAICGCDGYNASKLAQKVKRQWPISDEKLYDLAKDSGFGCDACRVVVTGNNTAVWNNQDEDLSDLYFSTIQKPKFNPRWESGIPERLSIVHIDKLGVNK